MAVAPTGAIYKALEFDGVSSGTYGVYITGEAVYNAPERDVDMVTIPGRNGTFAIDSGRFENIEVSYPAGIFADTEADFRQAISDFRNFLCSKKGYVRLTDEYNPDEYRMAIYKSGLEVEPAQLRAGQFDIVFDCKPQRFLTSGETKVTMTSGQSITNPTLFDSQPMLEVYGYGNIGIGRDVISIDDTVLGRIKISNDVTVQSRTANITLDTANLYSGDRIYVRGTTTRATLDITSNSSSMTGAETTSSSHLKGFAFMRTSASRWVCYLDPEEDDIVFAYGTASTVTASWAGTIRYGSSSTASATWTMSFAYDGDKTITITSTRTGWPVAFTYSTSIRMAPYYGDSTVGALGHPLYIDLETGEAWNNDSGTVVSSNNGVSIPAKLPVLKPGATMISFDNTITTLDIIPRWWKI